MHRGSNATVIVKQGTKVSVGIAGAELLLEPFGSTLADHRISDRG